MWSLGLHGSHINHPFRHWMDHSDKVNCTRLQSYSVNLSQAGPLSIILPWTSWEFPDYCICNSSFLRHRQIPFSFPPNFLVQGTRKFSYDSACYCSLYPPINQPPSFHLPPYPGPDPIASERSKFRAGLISEFCRNTSTLEEQNLFMIPRWRRGN